VLLLAIDLISDRSAWDKAVFARGGSRHYLASQSHFATDLQSKIVPNGSPRRSLPCSGGELSFQSGKETGMLVLREDISISKLAAERMDPSFYLH